MNAKIVIIFNNMQKKIKVFFHFLFKTVYFLLFEHFHHSID